MGFNFIDRLSVLGKFMKLVDDPVDLGNVIALETKLSSLASPDQIQDFLNGFRQSEMGQKSLIERPRLGEIKMEELRRMKPNTLGRQYVEFIESRGLDPYDLPARAPKNQGSEFEYGRAHILETHDIWHVVTGFDTDVAGELGLQTFYFKQHNSRLASVLISAGILSQSEKPAEDVNMIFDAIVRGSKLGQSAHSFVGRDWKKDWSKDIDELRLELGLNG